MKKNLFLLMLLSLACFDHLEAGQPITACNPGLQPADKWMWNPGCQSCRYFHKSNCQRFDINSAFECFFRAGACQNNGNNTGGGWGLRGNTDNPSYFNMREKVVVKNAPKLQVRGSNTPISITENDFSALIQPNMVQYTRRFNADVSVPFSVGTANSSTPQTWTIPPMSAFSAGREALYFVPISAVPVAARVAGETHAAYKDVVDDEGNSLREYLHYKFEAGQDLLEMGSSFVNGATVVNHGESSAQIYADSPLDLGDDFTTDVTTYYDDDSDLPKDVVTTHVVVDAFGTINDPYSNTTYDCLRATLDVTAYNYTTDINTPSSTTTTRYFMWVTAEGFRVIVKDPVAAPNVTEITMVAFRVATTLDVELLDFKGVMKGDNVNLTWTTASEKDNAGFDIERSTDGQTFEKIGFVKGNGTTTTKQSYDFRDASPPLGVGGLYYRLRQIDINGSTVTSNIISIAPKGNGKGIKVYPNPTSDNQITVDFVENTEGVSVVNALGQVVFQQKTVGQNRLQLDISTWAKGLYFVKTAGNTEGVKFVKQ